MEDLMRRSLGVQEQVQMQLQERLQHILGIAPLLITLALLPVTLGIMQRHILETTPTITQAALLRILETI